MPRHANGHIKSIVSSNIRVARGARTQRQFADLVGTDPITVSRWERGKVLPSLVNLQQLEAVTGRDISWFYTDHKEAA